MSKSNHRMKSKRREWWLSSWPEDLTQRHGGMLYLGDISPTLARKLDRAQGAKQQHAEYKKAWRRSIRAGSRFACIKRNWLSIEVA